VSTETPVAEATVQGCDTMANTLSKTVTITDGSTVLDIPCTRQKHTTANNVTSFSRPINDPPNSNGDFYKRRALNMNRIEHTVQIQATVSDDYVEATHDGSGSKPDYSDKEEWLEKLWELYVSGSILTYKAENGKTGDINSDVSVVSGYMHNMDWTENYKKEGSVYEVTLKIIQEVPMNS